MEQIKDEKLEKAQGFCQYMYARLQENEKLKKKLATILHLLIKDIYFHKENLNLVSLTRKL